MHLNVAHSGLDRQNKERKRKKTEGGQLLNLKTSSIEVSQQAMCLFLYGLVALKTYLICNYLGLSR